MTFKDLQEKLKIELASEKTRYDKAVACKIWIKRFTVDPTTSLEDLRKLTSTLPKL